MKIKWGALVVDGRGKLGGHVAAKNKGGSYLRTKTTPSNPNTAFQAAIRSLLGTFSAMWAGLTENQRLSFNGAVQNWSNTNIFGDIKNPTGKNLFTKLNINLANTGQAQVLTAPEKANIPNLELVSVEKSTLTGATTVTYTGDQDGNKILISATPVQSQGTYTYNGKFRKIVVADGATGDGVDITLDYEARFGAIALNDNIAVSVEVVAPNGQKSVASIQKIVYVA